MSTLYVVKPIVQYSEFGEYTGNNEFKVTHFCKCVNHYPSTSKTDIVTLNNQIEGTRELEIAWLNSCECPINCDTDIGEGYFAYLLNKFWKIVGIRTYEECGCIDIKLTLERLTPRETDKHLIECINCFEGDCHEYQ